MAASTVQQTLTELVAKIGENMSVRRTVALAVNPGVVAAYVHNAASPELGKIGVLVALKSTADKDKLIAAGQADRHACRRRRAAGADARASAPRKWWSAKRNVQTEIARQSGKPGSVIEKMMEGRMRKFYEETVLLQQTFVIDGETQIAKVIEKASKDLGAPVAIEGFVRFQVGEGIEKVESDFADEVAQMAGQKKPAEARIR